MSFKFCSDPGQSRDWEDRGQSKNYGKIVLLLAGTVIFTLTPSKEPGPALPVQFLETVLT